MRGSDLQQQEMFLYASLEDVAPADHPLRPIRVMVDEALRRLDDIFEPLSTVIPGMRRMRNVESSCSVSEAGRLPEEVLKIVRKHAWSKNYYQ